MKKEKKDKHFLKKPIYEGGIKAMRAFIRQNLKYPKAALEAKIEGTVHLSYTINQTGKVIHANIISGIGHGCDKEAIRLAKLLKFKVPKNRATKIKFHKKISIHFKLPKTKEAPKITRFQYNLTPAKKSSTDDKKQQSTYSYTLKDNTLR